jgi:hypothetical protein
VLICIFTPLMTTTCSPSLVVAREEQSLEDARRLQGRILVDAKSGQYCVSLGWDVTNCIRAITQPEMGGACTGP